MPLVPAATSLSRSVASARPGRLRDEVAPVPDRERDQDDAEVPEPLELPVGDAEDHQVALAAEVEASEAEGLDGDALVPAGDTRWRSGGCAGRGRRGRGLPARGRCRARGRRWGRTRRPRGPRGRRRRAAPAAAGSAWPGRRSRRRRWPRRTRARARAGRRSRPAARARSPRSSPPSRTAPSAARSSRGTAAAPPARRRPRRDGERLIHGSPRASRTGRTAAPAARAA